MGLGADVTLLDLNPERLRQLDREYSAQLLEFEGIYENSLDAVSDRDFIVKFLAASSTLMMHLSRFAEEEN